MPDKNFLIRALCCYQRRRRSDTLLECCLLYTSIRNLLNIPKEKERARIFELLDRMGMPKEPANKKPGELSGGQQKRVGIASALAVSPRYIVFDESISGLDVILRKSILELLKRVQEEEPVSYTHLEGKLKEAPL